MDSASSLQFEKHLSLVPQAKGYLQETYCQSTEVSFWLKFWKKKSLVFVFVLDSEEEKWWENMSRL